MLVFWPGLEVRYMHPLHWAGRKCCALHVDHTCIYDWEAFGSVGLQSIRASRDLNLFPTSDKIFTKTLAEDVKSGIPL
jgi:hypothetical protein